MKWLQWLPLIATLGLIYVLRWSHIGVTDFKVFVLIMILWTLLLILFYYWTRPDHSVKEASGEPLEAGISPDE